MQRLAIGAVSAGGIVGVLILSGAFLKITNLASMLGDLAIVFGVVIGIALGVLGVFGVISRYL
jgi:hypothetical protein